MTRAGGTRTFANQTWEEADPLGQRVEKGIRKGAGLERTAIWVWLSVLLCMGKGRKKPLVLLRARSGPKDRGRGLDMGEALYWEGKHRCKKTDNVCSWHSRRVFASRAGAPVRRKNPFRHRWRVGRVRLRGQEAELEMARATTLF